MEMFMISTVRTAKSNMHVVNQLWIISLVTWVITVLYVYQCQAFLWYFYWNHHLAHRIATDHLTRQTLWWVNDQIYFELQFFHHYKYASLCKGIHCTPGHMKMCPKIKIIFSKWPCGRKVYSLRKNSEMHLWFTCSKDGYISGQILIP